MGVFAVTTNIAPAAEPPAPEARIAASDSTEPFGREIALAGSVPGSPSAPVDLEFRAAGTGEWKPLRSLSTDGTASYRATVVARRSGAYQAVPATGAASPPAKVRVRARASLHVADPNPLVGAPVRLRGRAKPGGRRTVRIKAGGRTVARGQTAPDGSFRVRWKPSSTGALRLRAVVGRNRLAHPGHSAPRRVTAFRRAAASWYGPGLYGGALACGGTLTPGTLGVANKTLPCGTKLTLRYRGRSVRVAVVDRGPYSGSREFDLTAATKQRLGFPDTGYVLTSK